MRAEDLVFWLDALRDQSSNDHGVLCRRHADSMVVPRGWTLDDLRDPDLHLFRPPSDDTAALRRRRARRASTESNHEQLALGVDAAATASAATATSDVAGELSNGNGARPTSSPAPDGGDGESQSVSAAESAAEAEAEEPAPWMPVFDTDDDLDGLLAARSPLLSRAFRGERHA